MDLNKIYNGNCLEVLKDFPDNFFDGCVTDPPYGISFMNKHWDYQVAWQFEGGLLESMLDIVAMQDRNMLIIDWSGLEVNAIAKPRLIFYANN